MGKEEGEEMNGWVGGWFTWFGDGRRRRRRVGMGGPIPRLVFGRFDNGRRRPGG